MPTMYSVNSDTRSNVIGVPPAYTRTEVLPRALATTDLNAEIKAAMARGTKRIVIRAGNYTMTNQDVILADGVTIEGEYKGGVTITLSDGTQQSGTMRGALFTAIGVNNIALRNLNFAGLNQRTCILVTQRVIGIRLEGIHTGSCCLWWNGRGLNYDSYYDYSVIDAATTTRNVQITDCHGVGDSDAYAVIGTNNMNNSQQFIEGRYCYDVTIRDCSASYYWHGVQWWGGGSANESGTLWVGAERKAQNWVVDNFHGEHFHGASVWGSMGVNIKVTNCYSNDVADVGFDAEGCFDVVFENNTSINARFALYATFFGSRNVRFVNNYGEFNSDHAFTDRLQFYGNWNSSGDAQRNQGTVLDGNTFVSTIVGSDGNLASISDEMGCMWDPVVRNNRIINGFIDLGENNNRYPKVLNNTIEITLASTNVLRVIDVGYTYDDSQGASAEEYGIWICGNMIQVDVDQPAGSAFIHVFQEGSSAINFHWSTYIYDNTCKANSSSSSAGDMDRGIHIRSNAWSTFLLWNVYVKGNIVPNNCDITIEDYTERTITTTNGSNAITLSSDFLLADMVGREIEATGIPAGTTIASRTGSAAATLSANATATGSGVTAKIYTPRPVRLRRMGSNRKDHTGIELGRIAFTPSAGTVTAGSFLRQTYTLTAAQTRNNGWGGLTEFDMEITAYVTGSALRCSAKRTSATAFELLWHNPTGGDLAVPGTVSLYLGSLLQ